MSLRMRLLERRPPGHRVCDKVLLPRPGLRLIATALAGLAGLLAGVADCERAAAAFHGQGIAVHGMFALSPEADTRRSAGETVRFARRLGTGTIRMMMETPLPGSWLWERLKAERRLAYLALLSSRGGT